jgi:hypothetical protein
MKYTITITKTESVKEMESDYEQIYSNEIYGEILSKDPKAKQYAYVQHEVEKNKVTTVYEQTLDTDKINLKEIIEAVNL